MKNKVIFSILIVLYLLTISGCKSNPKVLDNKNDSSKELSSVKIYIDNNEYIINLENNETVNDFVSLLPLEIDMNELNGNEKYYYLNEKLKSNPINPKYINKGDVMLYGNNCLVIFYKSFDTSYSYTKIGHIDNLADIGSGNIKVKIVL